MRTLSATGLSLVMIVSALLASADNAPSTSEPRLTHVKEFAPKFREAVIAVAAVVANPGEYFASVSEEPDGRIAVDLRHESHDLEKYRGWLGDGCGKCRQTTYDPKTKKVGKIFGIR